MNPSFKIYTWIHSNTLIYKDMIFCKIKQVSQDYILNSSENLILERHREFFIVICSARTGSLIITNSTKICNRFYNKINIYFLEILSHKPREILSPYSYLLTKGKPPGLSMPLCKGHWRRVSL